MEFWWYYSLGKNLRNNQLLTHAGKLPFLDLVNVYTGIHTHTHSITTTTNNISKKMKTQGTYLNPFCSPPPKINIFCNYIVGERLYLYKLQGKGFDAVSALITWRAQKQLWTSPDNIKIDWLIDWQIDWFTCVFRYFKTFMEKMELKNKCMGQAGIWHSNYPITGVTQTCIMLPGFEFWALLLDSASC